MPGSTFPFSSLREQFPVLQRHVHGKPLIYLDNAATTQKPLVVLQAFEQVYTHHNANIHRGTHALSQETTERYEWARGVVADYLSLRDSKSVIFTSGATAAINLAAYSLGEFLFEAGDEILVSEMEHHSNLVPWQLLADRKRLRLGKIPVLDSGQLDIVALKSLLNSRVKVVAVTQVSNTLGVINPIPEIADLAHASGALLFVDGAQGVKHGRVSLSELKADLYAFSGHKIYGPNGIGILTGRPELLERFPPWQGGGEMVDTVSFDETTFAGLPLRLEAGTPPYAEAIALGEALQFYKSIHPTSATEYETQLLHLAKQGLDGIPGIITYGYHPDNAAILSFNHEKVHHYDLGVLLDRMGVAVRTGTHCTQPLMQRFEITGTVRASFAFYNTEEEVHQFLTALRRAIAMLS